MTVFCHPPIVDTFAKATKDPGVTDPGVGTMLLFQEAMVQG